MMKGKESLNTEKSVCEIFDEIFNEDILLPDFQRGFVWDDDKMRSLIASVLTKLPVGSLLMLEADVNEYACRKIGQKEMVNIEGKENKNIYALLDGQQRMTVLTHTFADFMINNNIKYNDLMSPKILYRRWFLKIPLDASETNDELFGQDKLTFPFSPLKGFPNFTTDQVKKYIHSIKISGNEKVLKDVNNHCNEKDINDFCCMYEDDEKKYCLIPLYYLHQACNDENGYANRILERIIEHLAINYYYDLLNKVRYMEKEEEKVQYIDNVLKIEDVNIYDVREQRTWSKFDKDNNIDEKWLIVALEKRKEKWAKDMITYLKSCIEKININVMYVNKAERPRAIEIYENINKGGKALSLFDLVLARAALRKSEITFLQTILEYIQQNHVDDYNEQYIPQIIRPHYKKYLANSGNHYSASERMGCSDETHNELTADYCNIFLQVLGLICNDPLLNKKNKNSRVFTSRNNILALGSDEINDNCVSVCKGIDRACFFFQARCGIRKLSEVSYKLVAVLISYVFSNDDLYKNERVHNWLEAWYWSVLFSGEFNTDPSDKFERWIYRFEEMFESLDSEVENISHLFRLRADIFNDEKFSSESFLLLEKENMDAPKNVMKNFICQFYMANVYKDFLLHENGAALMINTFMDDKEKLEEHHIVPIGNLENKLKDINQQKERSNKMNIYNSPLNFVYITARTNKLLLNNQLSYYKEYCVEGCFESTGIKTGNNEKMRVVSSDEELKGLLKGRFSALKNKVNRRLDELGIIM